MSAARLILLLLLILVAVAIVVVVLRRGAAQRDAHRVEAANLRSDAETLAASVAGQSVFADQAAERAEVARVEADERAREAARLEAEAAEHRAALEATQRDYEATMRRADDIDPDVKESAYPAVTESEGGHAGAAATQPDAGTDERGDRTDGDHSEHGEGEPPMTRAERREARDADGGAGWAAPAAASSAPAAGAVGGAAAGASAWAAQGHEHGHDHGHGEEHTGEQSERIASAADFRDDVPSEQTEVYAADERGSEPHMSDNSSTETTQHPGNDDGLGAGGAAAAASAGGGAYAATRAMHDDDNGNHDTDGNGSGASTATTDATDGATTTADSTDGADRSAEGVTHHTDTEHGSHDAEHGAHDAGTDHGDRGDRPEGEPAGMTIIGEPDAYATTEPVMASEQTAPVSPEQADAGVAQREGDADIDTVRQDGSADEGHDHQGHDHEGHDHQGHDHEGHDHEGTTDHAPAEAGAAVVETDGTDRSAADVAEESTQERYDPTPTRDWSADEGELLEQNSDRGDRLEAERTDLAHEAGDATPAAASDHGDAAADDGDTAAPSDEASGGTGSAGRRISAFEEIRDGGFGVGSAALLDDGAQPLDHPVKGHRDMTFHAPGDNGYDSAEPDVWFYDAGAAERSGFRRSDG